MEIEKYEEFLGKVGLLEFYEPIVLSFHRSVMQARYEKVIVERKKWDVSKIKSILDIVNLQVAPYIAAKIPISANLKA